jgi:hypothetical protein
MGFKVSGERVFLELVPFSEFSLAGVIGIEIEVESGSAEGASTVCPLAALDRPKAVEVASNATAKGENRILLKLFSTTTHHTLLEAGQIGQDVGIKKQFQGKPSNSTALMGTNTYLVDHQ